MIEAQSLLLTLCLYPTSGNINIIINNSDNLSSCCGNELHSLSDLVCVLDGVLALVNLLQTAINSGEGEGKGGIELQTTPKHQERPRMRGFHQN